MSEREVDAFDDIAGDAVAATHAEFFAEAMGNQGAEGDGDGDRSLESMGEGPEGRGAEDEGNEPEAEGAGQERGEDGKFAKPGGQQPDARHEAGLRGELRGERDRRQAAEQALADYRRDTDAKLEAMQRQIAQGQQPRQDAPQQGQPQAQQPAPPADAEPDMYLDPEGWRAWNGREMDRRVAAAVDRMEGQRIGRSFEAAHGQHGDKFTVAFQALNGLPPDSPEAKAGLATVKSAGDPGAALMAWHGRHLAMKEIGDDPAAYRAKVEAEVRALLAQQGQGGNAPPARPGAPDIVLPPSLNGSRGGQGRNGSTGLSLSDQRGMFLEATRGM